MDAGSSSSQGKILGTWKDMQKLMYYKEKPFRSSTPNTTVACNLCRGTGWNSIIRVTGEVVLRQCCACQGDKQIHTRPYNP